MQAQTRDVVQKKLIYLYLVGYSTIDPQKTMMAISTLQKDCFDDDPVIRGLALRSLCSMRLTSSSVSGMFTPFVSGNSRSTASADAWVWMGFSIQYLPSDYKRLNS